MELQAGFGTRKLLLILLLIITEEESAPRMDVPSAPLR